MTLPTTEKLTDIYRTSVTIRRTDERLLSMLAAGQARMTYYSPRGQETIAATVGALLGDDDYVVTIYRGLHDHIAAGAPLGPLVAEFLGKASGTCGGKGGPMHVTYPDAGLMVTTGIVGSGLPIANGLALAAQMRGEDRVTICNFGDGASNIGAFHEALTLASLWKLPVIFLCQNNLYSEHTAYELHSPVDTVASRGAAYGMRSVTVNGNDPDEMWAAADEAIRHARQGGGPTLLEAKTFRFRGHTFGDDGSYIPEDQMADAVKADPVPALRARLLRDGVSESDIVELESDVDRIVSEALQFAIDSPEPDVGELRTDVYSSEVFA